MEHFRVKIILEYLDWIFVTIVRKDRDIVNLFVRSNLVFRFLSYLTVNKQL